jgi:FixJ family two-component response regulator
MTTPPQDALIRIVDDENDVCEALSLMLDIEGWRTKVYHRAVDFLVEDDPRVPGCLLLDVRMPNMTGLELQEEMRKRNLKLPIVFITGHADIDVAIASLKRGALDFLLKPVDAPRLLTSVATIVQEDCDQRAMPLDSAALRDGFQKLSAREREILALFLSGLNDRAVAERLTLSERTVQGHRAKIYAKFGLHTAKELEAILHELEPLLREAPL